MAQFDVMKVQSTDELVVDCQSDLIRHLPTRVVVPLLDADDGLEPSGWLNPVFIVAGRRMIFAPQYIVSIPCAQLRRTDLTLKGHDLEITRAIDILVTGV